MNRTNEMVKRDVVEELFWDYRVDAANVNVQVDDGEVKMTGAVPGYTAWNAASEAAWSVDGVQTVTNQLDIEFPSDYQVPTDEEIKTNAEWTLSWNPDVNSLDIQVTVTNGEVKLEGTVDVYWKVWKAEQLVSNLCGVTAVENHLAVTPGDGILDKDIAKDIESALERNLYVDAEKVTVIVKNGKVTLTGTVPTYYARGRAYQAAALTLGVTEVQNNILVV